MSRRVASAVAVLALGVAGLAGCGGSDDERSADATPTAPLEVAPSEAASDTEAPENVGDFCAPFIEMVSALDQVDYNGSDAEQVAAMTPIMQEWAAQIADLAHPEGLPGASWKAVNQLADRLLDLPEAPTPAEFDAVEGEMSDAQKAALDDAYTWFDSSCHLDLVGR